MNTTIDFSSRLPHLGMLRFSGADAAAFLQGQLSNDTRRLAAGAPLLAALSSPQGRVISILHLMPHSSGIVAVLARDVAQSTLERLRKYVLRAKVQIDDVSDRFALSGWPADGALGAAGLPIPAAEPGYIERDGVGVARVGANRCWVFGEAAGLAGQVAGASAALTETAWRLADIREGRPQVYAATSELFVAQMLNLDLIDGISFTKGCFTGQEIIARTQHLGRIKRRLHRLRLPPQAWAVGQTIRLDDGRSGRLTELAAVETGVEALAVLALSATDAGTATEGGAAGVAGEPAAVVPIVEAVMLPLPYALHGA